MISFLILHFNNVGCISFCGINAHWQNGILEQYNGVVCAAVQTMLLHAQTFWPNHISNEMWPFAVQHVVNLYIILRPRDTASKVPGLSSRHLILHGICLTTDHYSAQSTSLTDDWKRATTCPSGNKEQSSTSTLAIAISIQARFP